MNNDALSDRKLKYLIFLTMVVIGWLCFRGATAGHAQSANASPAVQEVVKLTKAHMSDDVILAYIRNSGASYHLSADDILYLNSQGVSQPVISALLQSQSSGTPPAAAAPPVATAPAANPAPITPSPAPAPESSQVVPPGGVPPAEPMPGVAPGTEAPPSGSELSLGYFQSQLAPYGQWVNTPGYGQAWVPSVESQVPGWRPYFDGGHWEYTDNGWYWSSDYPWGEYVFHYGRWARTAAYGWVWVPGYHWGPAWVCWRNDEADGYCGWAPLPPGTHFEPGVGIMWNGQVAGDTDFGLAPDYFVFLPFNHFWLHDYHGWAAPGWRVPGLFRASFVINGFHFVDGRFFLGGIGRDRIAFLTHHDVPIFSIGFHDDRIAHDRAWGFDHWHDGRDGRGFRDHRW